MREKKREANTRSVPTKLKTTNFKEWKQSWKWNSFYLIKILNNHFCSIRARNESNSSLKPLESVSPSFSALDMTNFTYLSNETRCLCVCVYTWTDDPVIAITSYTFANKISKFLFYYFNVVVRANWTPSWITLKPILGKKVCRHTGVIAVCRRKDRKRIKIAQTVSRTKCDNLKTAFYSANNSD